MARALTFILVALSLSFLQLCNGRPAKPVLSESFSAKVSTVNLSFSSASLMSQHFSLYNYTADST